MIELQQIVSTPCELEDMIDDVLRAYLDLTVRYKGWFNSVHVHHVAGGGRGGGLELN